MFAQWARDQDEDGDLPMGVGLPGTAETRKYESKVVSASASLDDEDDDDDIVMPASRPAITQENKRKAAAALARLRSTETAVTASVAVSESKRSQQQQPEIKGTHKAAPADAVPAVLFVVDASAPTTEASAKLQQTAVEALLPAAALSACVISRGAGEVHTVGFNVNLACRACKETKALVSRVVVRTGGAGVHRTMQRVCSVCGLSLDKWALVESQLHTDAKEQAERILLGMRICFGVASKAHADDTLAWKAALGCLQDLACGIDTGPDKKQRVQKVVVFFTQSPTVSGVLLTMPAVTSEGQLELVPVIVVYTGAQSTEASAMHEATVSATQIDVVRERIRSATTRCNTMWDIAPSTQARWLSFAPFAPILLPPLFGLLAFAEEGKVPHCERCSSDVLVTALRQAYQRDPLLDDNDDPVDYAIFDRLKTPFAIASQTVEDGGSSEAGRSKEADEEGAKRGGKRQRRI